MSDIQRYNLAKDYGYDNGECFSLMEDYPSADGEWVKYEDHIAMNKKLCDEIEFWQTDNDKLQAQLDKAVDRIKDMLMGDDGQAWKEAEKFIERLGKE